MKTLWYGIVGAIRADRVLFPSILGYLGLWLLVILGFGIGCYGASMMLSSSQLQVTAVLLLIGGIWLIIFNITLWVGRATRYIRNKEGF